MTVPNRPSDGRAATTVLRAAFELAACRDGTCRRLRRQLMKCGQETFDIGLVVIDMRADAQTTEARCHEDVLPREPLGQALRHPVAKAQAHDMRGSEPCCTN